MNPSILAFDRTVTVKTLGGFLHIYNVVDPKHCIMPAEVAQKAIPFKGPLDQIVVSLPRSAAKSARNMIKILGEVSPLNVTKTLFKIVARKPWLKDLEKGCLMVGATPASVRPFYPEEVWRAQRCLGTVLVRGPNSAEEILEKWPKLAEIKAREDHLVQICQSDSKRTWFVRSPLRKCDASNLSPWVVIASGHCFNCGRPGHTERNCPNKKKRCRYCNSTSHTGEVCEARCVHLRADTARKYAFMVSGFIKSFNDHDELPSEVAFYLGKLGSAVRSLKRRNCYGPLGKPAPRKHGGSRKQPQRQVQQQQQQQPQQQPQPQPQPEQRQPQPQPQRNLRQEHQELWQKIHAATSVEDVLATVADLVPGDTVALVKDTMDALHLVTQTPEHGRQRKEVPPGTPDPSPEQPLPAGGAVRRRENDTAGKYRSGKFRAVMEEVSKEPQEASKAKGGPKEGSKACSDPKKVKGKPKKSAKGAPKTKGAGKDKKQEKKQRKATRSQRAEPAGSEAAKQAGSTRSVRSAGTVDSTQLRVDDFYPTVPSTEFGGPN